MATIDSTGLLVLSLCFIVVLTSTVSAVAGPDGTSSALPFPSQNSPSKSSLTATGEHLHSDDIEHKNISKIMAEGWLIPINSQQQENISDESKTRENAPKEKYTSSSVVARKGVKEKTVKARKGVDQSSLDPEQATESISQIILEDKKSIVENTATKAFVSTNEQLGTSNVDTPKLNTNSSRPNDILDHHSANSSSILISEDTTVSHTVTTNVTTMQKSSSPTQKKHIPKPKPTVTTVGKSEINESRLPLRNKSSPLGAQGKIDYIVPVIITIIALPLLGTAIFVLYRRGRDCWDKRHYRRMDFLIDGMYND